MLLTVNSESYEHRGDGTVTTLINEFGVIPEHTVLTVNGTLIRSGDWESFRLNSGDCVEILTFVGGG